MEKTCAYCGKDISHRAASAKVCSNSCKTRLSNQRKELKKNPPTEENTSDDETSQKGFESAIELLNREVQKYVGEFEKIDRTLDEWGYTEFGYPSTPNDKQYNDILLKIQLATKSKEKEALEIEKDRVIRQYQETKDRIINIDEYRARKRALVPLIFKAIEKRNDLFNNHHSNQGILSGEILQQLNSHQTKYPFQLIELEHIDLFWCDFKEIKQPFLAHIEGGKGTGKTLFAVKFADVMEQFFQSKVLYISDQLQKSSVKQAMEVHGIKSNNIDLSFSDAYDKIHTSLARKDYDVLVIDSISSFAINATHLNALQKRFPKLSIITIGQEIPEGVKQISDLDFRTDKTDHYLDGKIFSYGGGLELFIENKSITGIQTYHCQRKNYEWDDFGKNEMTFNSML